MAILHEVYTPEILEWISTKAQADSGFNLLHQTLVGSRGRLPIDREHFAKLLSFARDHNGLDADRLERLRKPEDYAAWKAVYNELLVPYFFTKVFGLRISFVVNPMQKGQGDFLIVHPKGHVVVEVKTPRGDDPNFEGPQGGVHWGWDEELIETAFLQAAGQLRKGNLNLVVICTQLCVWIHDWMPFERLLYGEDVIVAAFDPRTGNTGEPRNEFRPDGELLRGKKKRHTRISAVASFRTDAYCAGPFDSQVMQVQFAVLHNYFAKCPIARSVFRRAEQFLPVIGKGRIKHVKEHRSTILLYLTDGWVEGILKRVSVLTNLLYRRIRGLYYRVKVRRAMRTMKSGASDDFGDGEDFE